MPLRLQHPTAKPIQLHWAINSSRPTRLRAAQRTSGGKASHEFGRTWTWEQWDAEVRCLVPDHTFVVASSCRRERSNWHNRIHHAYARYVATRRDRITGRVALMEYGMAACGRHPVNPLYVDEPSRLCDCGGSASMCPQCELVVHKVGPTCAAVA